VNRHIGLAGARSRLLDSCNVSDVLHIVVGVAGILLVIGVWRDLLDTVVTTRHGQRFSAARRFFQVTWRWYSRLARRIDDPGARERFLVPYGPVSLVGLLAVWVALLVFGWGLVWWGLQNRIDGIDGLVSAVYFSGVTFLTIGFGDIVPEGDVSRLLAVVEGLNGIITIALVIGLLPTLFSAYTRREAKLLTLDTLEDQVTPLSYLQFHVRNADLHPLYEQFKGWDAWCADVYDSHTAYPMLLWFRSRQPGRSWTVGLGIVLEAASYVMSTVDMAGHHEAQMLYRRAVMLIDAIRTTGHVHGMAATFGWDEHTLRQQFERVHAAIVELGLPTRPLDEAYEREQLLRDDYVAGLLGINDALVAPFEFRTHARPLPVAMRTDGEPAS
jgi:Ion channel